ncbi:hypothetical protein DAA51_27755 [Bradyrhizobium sp. WBAH10]|nr:hypothetical protein [Bradyrhizobium sp. WBAH30]MDD1542810.1 hypothetical protein [Bradyrhizobium sp. WBAH41]MDD1554507.1 hypothetical protein [Bradyrhizobium sp. WBAH23]MDD1562458.1 hypothetical protein [Bradyrhizobium sp. WBAH33]MDD1588752.1 hypothetical protein [Bradyrhizobium sp. WBAH42]NRB85516.1 hypothetical protein [Bradyrhizobium sp. WBAH10]
MACAECPRALNGWFRGCVAATGVLHAIILASFIGTVKSAGQLVGIVSMLVFVLPLTLLIVCTLTGLPAGAVIWLAERLHIRSLLFYSISGAAIGSLFCALLFQTVGSFGPSFVLAGGAAGLVYWFVAGRYAGQEGQWFG